MKKIVLLGSLFISVISFAQLTLTRHNGNSLGNGQVYAYNNTGFLTAELDFKVNNTSTTNPVNVKISCTSLINTDGEGFELCFANECLSSVVEGDTYPVNAPYLTLAPGTSSGNDGHLLNTVVGSGPYPKDFSFRFFHAGNPNGNTIDITYRFDPNLTVEEINQLQTSGVIVKSTVVENELILDVLKSTTMMVYDLNGKVVYTSNLDYGIQSIDVSNFNSGVYIINFTNAEGISSTKKFIKK
jgi:hypothetical protein